MKLTILTENTAGGKFLAEHGISYLIEVDDQKILFDTGHSDVFLKNACMLGIDIKKEVEKIVLSHGHWDHGNGLQFLENKILVVHPGAFIRRFRKRDFSTVGLSPTKTELEKKFKITESKSPLQITKNLFFLGEIPRENHFEAQTTPFADDFQNDDFIPDDSALAAIVKNEVVIITGCSHSGICNIVEHAKRVTGISQVSAVLGGFHLKFQDEQTRETVNYFKTRKIKRIFPSHCTELPALAAFYNEFKNPQLKTGMVLEF
jgi:7,8-dihydropterin-6-yl-methyl-4-(beta-D-ribofuranosyl)aminobenzene 5'-phosphate synthase